MSTLALHSLAATHYCEQLGATGDLGACRRVDGQTDGQGDEESRTGSGLKLNKGNRSRRHQESRENAVRRGKGYQHANDRIIVDDGLTDAMDVEILLRRRKSKTVWLASVPVPNGWRRWRVRD